MVTSKYRILSSCGFASIPGAGSCSSLSVSWKFNWIGHQDDFSFGMYFDDSFGHVHHRWLDDYDGGDAGEDNAGVHQGTRQLKGKWFNTFLYRQLVDWTSSQTYGQYYTIRALSLIMAINRRARTARNLMVILLVMMGFWEASHEPCVSIRGILECRPTF